MKPRVRVIDLVMFLRAEMERDSSVAECDVDPTPMEGEGVPDGMSDLGYSNLLTLAFRCHDELEAGSRGLDAD